MTTCLRFNIQVLLYFICRAESAYDLGHVRIQQGNPFAKAVAFKSMQFIAEEVRTVQDFVQFMGLVDELYHEISEENQNENQNQLHAGHYEIYGM